MSKRTDDTPPSVAEHALKLRIVLRRPPPGVRFALQSHATAGDRYPKFMDAKEADGEHDLAFEVTVRVQSSSNGVLRFLGPFTHGPPSSRFVYLTVGKRAGQPDSPWEHRVKIPLTAITADLLAAANAQPGSVLEAVREGTLSDGSPTSGTRPFEGEGWVVGS
jgi:hypothetical protein